MKINGIVYYTIVLTIFNINLLYNNKLCTEINKLFLYNT